MTGPNWANQTIWTGDNLAVMRGMNSESVDLIYLDPPFNSNANYAAPIGSQAAGAEFKDTWSLSEIDVEWINLIEAKHSNLYRVLLAATTKSDKSYLVYMAARLLEMHRLLKPTGSVYLHCDPTMSHYLKLVMDSIFGRKAFRNEIIWSYRTGGVSKKHWPRKHDTLLFYVRGANYRHNPPQERIYYDKKFFTVNVDSRGRFFADVYVRDVWDDIKPLINTSKERTGYPTQKPLALLRRIIKASSDENDIVLDPFCGCATACIAAHELKRQWIGIDIGEKASDLVHQRMIKDLGLYYHGLHRTDIPHRTDVGQVLRPSSHENRQWLYGKQQGYCQGCQKHFEARNLEVDHIIAKAKGGTDHRDNLQLLCGYCNRVKGDRGMEYLMAKLNMSVRKHTEIVSG